jgi:hypothetical protein
MGMVPRIIPGSVSQDNTLAAKLQQISDLFAGKLQDLLRARAYGVLQELLCQRQQSSIPA